MLRRGNHARSPPRDKQRDGLQVAPTICCYLLAAFNSGTSRDVSLHRAWIKASTATQIPRHVSPTFPRAEDGDFACCIQSSRTQAVPERLSVCNAPLNWSWPVIWWSKFYKMKVNFWQAKRDPSPKAWADYSSWCISMSSTIMSLRAFLYLGM
jgi:hypothetical protein